MTLQFVSGSAATSFLRSLRREGHRLPYREASSESADCAVYGRLLYEEAADQPFTLYASADAVQLAIRLGLALPPGGEVVELEKLPDDVALLYRGRTP